jgi:integrase
MGRPPLPLGTGGKIRFIAVGQNWVARCGFRDCDGVTRAVERTGWSKAAAERALKVALRDRVQYGRGAEVNADAKLSVVAEWWWEVFAAGDGSLGTKIMYRQMLDNHVIPRAGNIRCREFTVAAAERFLRRVEQLHGRPLARSVRTVLSNVCGYAARLGAMAYNPVRDTSRIRINPRRGAKALSPVQVRQLRAYVSYLPVAVRRDVPAVMDVLAATGLRIGECLALTDDAVDLASRTVQVRGTVARYPGVGIVFSRRPKTEAGYRTLTLPEWVMPTVEAHVQGAASLTVRVLAISEDYALVVPATTRRAGRRRAQPPGWLQGLLDEGQYWQETIAVIFPSAAGTFRDPSTVSRDIKAALTFAGFDHETSHLLRRCVATQMDDAGVAVREIADQLGHSRPSMTQDVYLGRSPVSTKGASALKPFGFPSQDSGHARQ